jgi:hypothetical protein
MIELPPPLWMPPKPAIIRAAKEIKQASFLPGMFPAGIAGVAAAPAALTTITLFASATSTGATINFPASIIAGDLIVLLDSADASSGGAPATVTPSGFTLINSSVELLQETRQVVSYKLALGTESGALTGMDGNAADRKAMYVFRGDIPATTLTVSTPNAQATAGNPTPQNVAASAGIAPLVVFGCYGALTEIVGESFSPAEDGEITPTNQVILKYKIYNSAPQDTTVDMLDEGNVSILQSFYIEMA